MPSIQSSPCNLCPRQCGVDRSSSLGFCKAGAVVRMYRWGAHHGEEPPISGERGSGTLFFSHCTLSCMYCQNYTWSQEHRGELHDVDSLAAILTELHRQGCHNWNLVAPTPWLPFIRAAAERVKNAGISLPFVYNTSGFERLGVASEYHDLMDVVLTDLRYANPETAAEASAATDYVEHSRAYVKWAWENVGPLETDAEGIARRGTICRLLVLPGHADEAIANLEWMADRLGTEIAVSLMAQYTPVYKAVSKAGWNRRVTPDEYARVTRRLETLGFENGWVQDVEESPPDRLLGCTMTEGGDKSTED